MNKLDSQVKKITNQMKNTNTESDVVSQMEEFLPVRSSYEQSVLSHIFVFLNVKMWFHDNQKQPTRRKNYQSLILAPHYIWLEYFLIFCL